MIRIECASEDGMIHTSAIDATTGALIPLDGVSSIKIYIEAGRPTRAVIEADIESCDVIAEAVRVKKLKP